MRNRSSLKDTRRLSYVRPPNRNVTILTINLIYVDMFFNLIINITIYLKLKKRGVGSPNIRPPKAARIQHTTTYKELSLMGTQIVHSSFYLGRCVNLKPQRIRTLKHIKKKGLLEIKLLELGWWHNWIYSNMITNGRNLEISIYISNTFWWW